MAGFFKKATSDKELRSWTELDDKPRLIVCPVCGHQAVTRPKKNGGSTIPIFYPKMRQWESYTQSCSHCKITLGTWYRQWPDQFSPAAWMEEQQESESQPTNPAWRGEPNADFPSTLVKVLSPLGPGSRQPRHEDDTDIPKLPEVRIEFKASAAPGRRSKQVETHYNGPCETLGANYGVHMMKPFLYGSDPKSRPAFPHIVLFRSRINPSEASLSEDKTAIAQANFGQKGCCRVQLDAGDIIVATTIVEQEQSRFKASTRLSAQESPETSFTSTGVHFESSQGWLGWKKGPQPWPPYWILFDAFKRDCGTFELTHKDSLKFSLPALRGDQRLIDQIIATAWMAFTLDGEERLRSRKTDPL